jgi:hypothetical protein
VPLAEARFVLVPHASFLQGLQVEQFHSVSQGNALKVLGGKIIREQLPDPEFKQNHAIRTFSHRFAELFCFHGGRSTPGVDQAVHRKPETRLMRKKTPSFIAEFPLSTKPADERELSIRLDGARQIYNACLGESLRRLDLMRESKAQCRNACWIGDHLGSHDTQTTTLRAFRAVEQYAFGERRRPCFTRFNQLESIEGKEQAVIRYKADPMPALHYAGLVIALMLDSKDKDQWQQEALACRVKYTRILRRQVGGKTRWYTQLVMEGLPPTKGRVTG